MAVTISGRSSSPGAATVRGRSWRAGPALGLRRRTVLVGVLDLGLARGMAGYVTWLCCGWVPGRSCPAARGAGRAPGRAVRRRLDAPDGVSRLAGPCGRRAPARVDVGNVSGRRDGWGLGPAQGEDPDAWLNSFNHQWVDAARRICPALLIELINLAGVRFEGHLAALDLDAVCGQAKWATGSYWLPSPPRSPGGPAPWERSVPDHRRAADKGYRNRVHRVRLRAAARGPRRGQRRARP